MAKESKEVLERAHAAAEQARGYREAGEVELAAYVYAHSLEWSETAEARSGLAWTYAYAGKLEEAARECRRAIALDPEDGRASNDLGVYLMQQGQDEEAITHLLQAVQSRWNPDRHFPWYNLGRIHERRQELGEAASAYEAALGELPTFEAARKALDRIERKLGPNR